MVVTVVTLSGHILEGLGPRMFMHEKECLQEIDLLKRAKLKHAQGVWFHCRKVDTSDWSTIVPDDETRGSTSPAAWSAG
jgi:hypothetical protein